MEDLQCSVDISNGIDTTAFFFWRKVEGGATIEKVIHLTPEETKLLIAALKIKERQ